MPERVLLPEQIRADGAGAGAEWGRFFYYHVATLQKSCAEKHFFLYKAWGIRY